ncbi:3-keto-disaccharide hydrolase [Pseudoduganella lutea]|uniref:DUF1080 domain-containing protein n=1 Tax=Pseudoduganella lutea TaxID=321985 RepID=A0A4P6KVS9_9BURK|nr:DUF1080 domain-containing protein [Pseudoduganella lutea]QBE62785.1 DUF1080 domain-containing protein [Pseudoduganella lutea]
MIRKILCTGLLALCVSAGAESLFDARGLAGWELRTDPAAAAADVFHLLPDGVIGTAGKPSGFLATRGSYRNYRLHVEWRWTDKPGNGGVLLHISDGPMDRVWPTSVQVQTKHGAAGDLLPMASATFAEPPTSAPGTQPVIKARTGDNSERPAGEWNSADIVCRDGTIEVAINGVAQNRITKAQPAEGRIGFQLEGAPYQLRNVTLEKL